MSETTEDEERFLSNIDRAQLERDGEPADEAYRHLLDILVKHKWLSVTNMQMSLGEKMGLPLYDSFQEEYKKFKGERRKAVLDYIDSNNLLKPYMRAAAAKVDARLYSELIDFLGIGDGTQRDAPKYLVGTYQTWRHSVSTPGAYIKGSLQITARNFVLFARAHQRFIPDDPISEKHLKPRFEYLRGYIFRQPGGRCFLFLSDRSRRQVRLCILPGIAPVTAEFDDRKPGEPLLTRAIFSLGGTVLGTDEGKSFTSPVYIERVSDQVHPLSSVQNDEFRESLNVYFKDDVPRKVLANLDRPIVTF